MTTNQARDTLLDSLKDGASTDLVQELKNFAQQVKEERKQDTETYSKCPRCYDYHSIHGNFDNLCDRCQSIILTHFPEHESVPYIKEALKKWNKHETT